MSERSGAGPEDEERGPEQDQEHSQDGAMETVLDSRERAFTCVLCGFSTIAEAQPLQYEVQSVCANCGDWTTQLADQNEIIEVAKEIATELEGPTLTERQALAYLLRTVVGLERQPTADVMDTSPSNVDNLQRKATEKLEDAEQVLDALDTVQPDEPTA